jgi:hypothetical protein
MQLNNKETHAVLINSVRYCLTRHSYAPSECADLIRSKWGEIPENTKNIIAEDISGAILINKELDYQWPSDILQTWTNLREFMDIDK